jgi:hypothetical protein
MGKLARGDAGWHHLFGVACAAHFMALNEPPRYFILDGHEAVPCDVMTWARWFEKANRQVARDVVGDVVISTVFIGFNLAFESTRLHLFETMIFGGKREGYTTRCATWRDAEVMHTDALALVRRDTLRVINGEP